METKKQTSKSFSPEVRDRAVRMVREHRGTTARNGRRFCRSPRRSAARERICVAGCGKRNGTQATAPGLTSDERARLKALERENLELRQANEILRKASAYFAQAELDRRFKP